MALFEVEVFFGILGFCCLKKLQRTQIEGTVKLLCSETTTEAKLYNTEIVGSYSTKEKALLFILAFMINVMQSNVKINLIFDEVSLQPFHIYMINDKKVKKKKEKAISKCKHMLIVYEVQERGIGHSHVVMVIGNFKSQDI